VHASNLALSRQISLLSAVFGVVLVTALGGFGWWAANRIDERSTTRQIRSVEIGLQEMADRVPVEQDTSVVWDEAVVNLRAGNDAWIAENLAEWISAYFGHDYVFLLDPEGRPVRAVKQGERLPEGTYKDVQEAVEPLVSRLRSEMIEASEGEADSTESVTGMGVMDKAVLSDGTVGIVSVRPVLPSSGAVTQAPGTEFLHVSIRVINDAMSQAIAAKFDIDQLRFERLSRPHESQIATPVLNSEGRILGFFTWSPERPALQLVRDTAPLLLASFTAAGLMVVLLLQRLKRTSAQLEVSQAHATYLAFHDPLAGIPNRALFEDRLERAIANRRRSGEGLAIHSIDLDRFKQVNDTLGHGAGDELIRQAAARLSALVREIDTVARLGGDEFAVLQIGVQDVNGALLLSQRIVAELDRPFDLKGHEASVSASVGVVYSDDMSSEPEDLLRQADIALYEAKTSGRNRYQLFAGELDHAVRARRALELELRSALHGEPGLELVYQPIYHATGRGVAGAEALVRWNHPKQGRLSPDLFIGLAEERGLIDQLGLWVLREACTYAAASNIPWVAVNVSPLQFRDERFADRVFGVLQETGLEPCRLEIEITEGLLLQNSPAVQALLRQLRAGGVRVALDDFGTGYSSISYLRMHGVDKLKIDKSFVAQMGQDEEIESIIRSIIDLARAMRMQVTAEGVETLQQETMLKAMGCDQLQGYLLSRPLTSRGLASLLEQEAAGVAERDRA
jgi:diguanylate cyclase (GGDEF)-like protein